ncbi:hypothetical protein NX059_006500 [Plenodomus lindquistii]|nr:hypothetical protein NX059_006500 [Plenodomus lindquistii]
MKSKEARLSQALRSTLPPHTPKGPRALRQMTLVAEAESDQPLGSIKAASPEHAACQPSPLLNGTCSPVPSTADQTILPTRIPGYVSEEEHEQALSKIAQLSRNLDDRIAQAETASKACRDLAAWTYNERSKLHQEMTATNSESTRKIKDAREDFLKQLRQTLETQYDRFEAENELELRYEDHGEILRRTFVAYRQDIAMMDIEGDSEGRNDTAAADSVGHMHSESQVEDFSPLVKEPVQ